jgi:hypothetical protein
MPVLRATDDHPLQIGGVVVMAIASDGLLAHSSNAVIAPGGNYVASRIFTSPPPHGPEKPEWFCTLVEHIGDDPSFKFRTEENSPWLTKKQRKAINAPHRAPFRRLVATMKVLSPDVDIILDRASKAFLEELELRREVRSSD